MKLDSMEKMALSLPFYICSLFLSLLLYSSATLDPIPLATAPIARASATLESPRVSSEPPETARGSEEEAFFDVEAGLSVGAPLGALGGLRAGAWPPAALGADGAAGRGVVCRAGLGGAARRGGGSGSGGGGRCLGFDCSRGRGRGQSGGGDGSGRGGSDGPRRLRDRGGLLSSSDLPCEHGARDGVLVLRSVEIIEIGKRGGGRRVSECFLGRGE